MFRLLKEPVKSMILDLRSQQVRDTCTFLIKLSFVTRDHLKSFMREIFSIIIDALRVPNKVMSGYVDDCILQLIKNTNFKSQLHLIINELKDNKSKAVREYCIEYVNEILIHWDISEKEADIFCDCIKLGLQDASVRVREVSRLAYLNFFQSFPKKADKIKSNLPSYLKTRLIKAEASLIEPNSPPKPPVSSNLQPKSPELQSSGNNSMNMSHKSPIALPSSDKKLALRARRQSYEENAITSIQAVFRGALTRKQSLGHALKAADLIKEVDSENSIVDVSDVNLKSLDGDRVTISSLSSATISPPQRGCSPRHVIESSTRGGKIIPSP